MALCFCNPLCFQTLVKNKTLKPFPNVDVKVEIVDLDTSDFPVTTCQTCNKLLAASGLLESVSVVKWRLLQTCMYDLTEEVSQSHMFV